jgi:hypothetical protein
VLPKHQDIQSYGLPEFARGVSPAHRAQVMAGMYLKIKEKFSGGYGSNHPYFCSYGKIRAGSSVQRDTDLPVWTLISGRIPATC